MKQCGCANAVKIDEPLLINHRLGKVRLHVASTQASHWRVKLDVSNTLRVQRRDYGTSWYDAPQGLPAPLQEIVSGFLVSTNNHRDYYLYDTEFDSIVERHRG